MSAAAYQHPFLRTPLPSHFAGVNTSVVAFSPRASSSSAILLPLYLLHCLLYLLQIISKAKKISRRTNLRVYRTFLFFALLGVLHERISLLFGRLHCDQLLRDNLILARLIISHRAGTAAVISSFFSFRLLPFFSLLQYKRRKIKD